MSPLRNAEDAALTHLRPSDRTARIAREMQGPRQLRALAEDPLARAHAARLERERWDRGARAADRFAD